MKKLLLYGYLLFCVSPALHAQRDNPFVVTYIAEIPIIIQSGVYIDSLPGDHIFRTISGKISIALAPRKKAILSDQYFKIARPIQNQQLSEIEYRYFINEDSKSFWQSLPHQDNNNIIFPYAGLLVDTTIHESDKLLLQFRYRGSHKMIQQCVFSRPELLPVISSFRQKSQFDSLDVQIKSNAVKDSKKVLDGFEKLNDDHLIVSPGNYVECLFQKLSLNKDSCIQYRLRKINKKGNTSWGLTGHLLVLKDMKANSHYILEVKYTGMDVSNTYLLRVLPYWYQTSWAKTLFLILGIITLIGAPYLFYLYRLRIERKKRTLAQDQLKRVQSQLNPHFVYNALSSIEGLVTNKENERANEYLTSFSDIMRNTLKNSDILFVSLAQDIEMMEKYIRIEQLRFEFKYIIDIDPELDLEAIEFPPMLLQPMVENAVKHGMAGLGSQGIISLSFQKKGVNLEIIIKDNGTMRKEQNKNGHGYGIKFTLERIESLRKLFHKEKIDYQLSYADNGTIARFLFENWIEPIYESNHH